jgi:putative endonuclease
MFYLYILHSATANKHYVGHAENVQEALTYHNTNTEQKYTGKFQDWTLQAVFEAGKEKASALEMEKFINKQKNIKLVLKLIDPAFVPADKLAALVRVAM